MTPRFGGGTLVKRATTTGEGATTFVEIPGIKGDITLPGGQAAKIEIQTHNDIAASGRRKLYGAGLQDTQDLSFELLFDPDDATHQAMLTDSEDGSIREYEITFADGVTRKWKVLAAVGNFTPRAPENDFLRCQFALFVRKLNTNA